VSTSPGTKYRIAADRVTGNPSRLSETGRTDLGISNRLPRKIEESLRALEEDDLLQDALGGEVVEHYVAMKKAEQTMLNEMPDSKRRMWLMERY
jgi:glutamine synthetase